MNITEERDGQLSVFKCEGEFNLSGGAAVAEKLAALGEESKILILDLSGVSFMDSSGIGQLVSIFKKCSLEDRGFALAGLTTNVTQLLSITKLDRVFKIFASISEAKSQLK